jgi:hypothetical protein
MNRSHLLSDTTNQIQVEGDDKEREIQTGARALLFSKFAWL